MKIDPKTGTVIFDKRRLALSPEIKRDKFLASPPGSIAHLIVENQGYSTYSFEFQNESILYGIMVTFEFQRLDFLSFKTINVGEKWSDYSAKRELERKLQYDHLLASFFGPPPYTFEWGEVGAAIDPHYGCASIDIRFKISR